MPGPVVRACIAFLAISIVVVWLIGPPTIPVLAALTGTGLITTGVLTQTKLRAVLVAAGALIIAWQLTALLTATPPR